LTTVHQRYRQTGQTDRQRTDSIGRTVLQTVAQKRSNNTEKNVKNIKKFCYGGHESLNELLSGYEDTHTHSGSLE